MSVLVFAENWEGKFKKGTFEAVTYGYETAQKLGLSTIAITIGDLSDNPASLGNYGAEKVICVKNNINNCDNNNLAKVIAETAKKENSNTIILTNSNTGKSIASRLAIKMNAALISNVIAIMSQNDPLIVKRKAFSGKAFENTQCNQSKCILTLAPNSFYVKETGATAIIESTEIIIENSQTTFVSVEQLSGKINLSEAEIVVSGGRGLKGPENWNIIEDLAEVLNAGTACSKPVSDIGWRPHGEHVGQTGKAIAPNLYFAIGISGAIQHLAGVNSSKVMVAINTDPEAPFFKAADYGIIGDAFEVVPRLTKAIRNFKEKN